MKKKALILLAASLVGAQAWAGNVSIPNTFTDGATASAGEVNDNFTAIESAVNDNDGRITTNATNIQTNSSSISTNATVIQTNTSQIQSNTSAIIVNTSGVVNNTNNISTNASSIQSNAANISTNASEIGVNAADVNTNANEIATNSSDINNNAVTVEKLSADLQQKIDEFETRIAALENPPQPPREFIDNGNGTVTDTGTGLMWEMKDARDSVADYSNPHDTDNVYTWTSLDDGDGLNPDGTVFTDFLASLNNVATPLAGYTNWRLPTLEELKTTLYEPEPCISPIGLNACVVDPLFWPSTNQRYWTSTDWVIDPAYISTIFFADGHIGTNIKYGSGWVRAVRNVQ